MCRTTAPPCPLSPPPKQNRDVLTRLKQARDSLRLDNQRLRQRGGLVCHSTLLADFEERQDQVSLLHTPFSSLWTGTVYSHSILLTVDWDCVFTLHSPHCGLGLCIHTPFSSLWTGTVYSHSILLTVDWDCVFTLHSPHCGLGLCIHTPFSSLWTGTVYSHSILLTVDWDCVF